MTVEKPYVMRRPETSLTPVLRCLSGSEARRRSYVQRPSETTLEKSATGERGVLTCSGSEVAEPVT